MWGGLRKPTLDFLDFPLPKAESRCTNFSMGNAGSALTTCVSLFRHGIPVPLFLKY